MDVASLRVGDQVRSLITGRVYVVEVAEWDAKYSTAMVQIGRNRGGEHYVRRLWDDIENMADRERDPAWEKVEVNPLEVL